MRAFSFSGAATPLLLLLGLLPAAPSAGILYDQKGLGWASFRDITSQDFSDRFEEYMDKGYILIDMDGYAFGNSTRYSMIWQENKDKRGWGERRNLTWDQYHDHWVAYRDRGWRPHDVEAYPLNGAIRWAGIWVENKEGIAWSSHRGLTNAEFGSLFTERVRSGFRLASIEAYETPDGIRWSAIWNENTDNRPWAELRGLTRDEYQAEVDARSAQGFHVVDFESYTVGNEQRYAAIWEKKPGYAWRVASNRTDLQFANLWRQYADEGFRLVDFERYETPSGDRYAGVWAENDSRFRYRRKAAVDSLILAYQTTNSTPGISVAMIRNGQTIYRRGFGFADVAAGKVAHGQTVYNAASVSKVYGGTLAAKLEDELTLRNGTSFTLNLGQTTRSFLTNIPDDDGTGTATLPNLHTHTVDQLLSHLGCVAHYPGETTPSIADQTTHYANASLAVQNIWGTGLVTTTAAGTGCTVGTTRSYSTPAFTFLGAVLEQATGRTINQLLQNELFTPYGLAGTRVQFATSTLPANYDRAIPYNNAGNPTTYDNSSWKVLGGGIESHAVDMARFGWRVLNGEILSAAARDNRLWTRVNPNRIHGLGWAVVDDPSSRRTAEWNGSWSGARSLLRCYRDDGLVIAIMSNRRIPNTSVYDVDELADDLGDAVLAP